MKLYDNIGSLRLMNIKVIKDNKDTLYEGMVENAPDITSVLPEFMEFISQDVLLGHNISFDLRFIRHNLFKHFKKEFFNQKLDTMRLSRKYMTHLPSHRLKTVAEYFNVSTKGHHRALNDCLITYEIYKNIKQICS